MKILFINPTIRYSDDPRHLPHGIALLASLVRQNGYEVEVLDINAYRYSPEEVKRILDSSEYDVVGVGGIISIYREVKWISEYLKSIKPDVPIIVGGSVGSSISDIILEKTKVDFTCIGEGEETLLEFLDACRRKTDFEHIKGLAFMKKGKVCYTQSRPLIRDLDRLPLPAYDLFPIEIYINNQAVGLGRELDFVSSRGCPYNCIFCYQGFGRGFRAHSPDYIIKVMEHLKKNYDIDFLYLGDDEFMVDFGRVREFIKKKMENKYTHEIRWSCCSRVNLANLDLYREMKKAGCTYMGYGFESGSDFILKKIKKGITSEQQKNAVRITRESGIRLGCSFMLGFPWETYETAQATVNLCVEMQIPLSALLFATPYPKTELFDYCWQKGILNNKNLEDFVLGMGDVVDLQLNITENFTNKELIDLRDKMLKEVAGKVSPPSKELIKKQFIDLYGEKRYLVFKEQYSKNSKLREHLKKHGFNEFFE